MQNGLFGRRSRRTRLVLLALDLLRAPATFKGIMRPRLRLPLRAPQIFQAPVKRLSNFLIASANGIVYTVAAKRWARSMIYLTRR